MRFWSQSVQLWHASASFRQLQINWWVFLSDRPMHRWSKRHQTASRGRKGGGRRRKIQAERNMECRGRATSSWRLVSVASRGPSRPGWCTHDDVITWPLKTWPNRHAESTTARYHPCRGWLNEPRGVPK